MSRMTKTLQSVKQAWKSQHEHLEEASPDLSSIEKDSIFQDDQSNSDGNPLHSTAMEDDFSPIQTQQKKRPVRKTGAPLVAEGMDTPRRISNTLKRQSDKRQEKAKEKGSKNQSSVFTVPSVPPLPSRLVPKPTAMPLRKISEESTITETSESASASGTGRDSEVSASVRPLQKISSAHVPETSKRASASQGTGRDSKKTKREAASNADNSPSPSGRRRSQPVRRSQGKVAGSKKVLQRDKDKGQRTSRGSSVVGAQKQPRRSSGRVPMQKIPERNDLQQETPASAEDAENDSDGLMDEGSAYIPPRKRSRSGQLSQEEDEGSSINAEGQKNGRGQKKSRSSSSSSRKSQSRKSSSGSSDTANGVKRKKQKVRNPIDLEVVLEAFQDFVEQYKETVDSNNVRKAIDHLSESFVDQLTEAITATKELTNVKKKNAKLNTAMNNRRSKLVDSKNELIQSEAKLRALEKEHKQLEQRVTDLTQGMTLLSGLTELHTNYLAHCQEHPEETHTYSSTSVPALLLEARCMLGAERQLQTVNAKLQQVLDSVDKK